MYGFLDNIAAVVTTDSETMQQMVVAVATLMEINKQQAAIIASQQKTIADRATKPSTLPGNKTWEPHPGYETGNTT